ncbi:TauD/TfdA dioxygenase family protein [Mesorhizobium escarrei]|uniref:Alpha-ketoglutarate-dependent sulfate ester dioxygenase n=1 Tax=Mesorhizobium escarrei TaxID=666018 RepID=A0ABM9E7G5_9HYPH|nr:TauD/TfdA family dioxygenase [Mesorhizobium escarrei]CAH2405081.1 Alpha-ketoglutarate-dependent sulfate ester dioxygenase [Mesorhizobium escarrei]
MNETSLIIDSVIPRTAVVKCTARIGAYIRNIKLSGDLPDQTIAAIKSLLLEHKVIFFRDQSHLDDAEHERFAIRFGKPMLSPTLDPANGTISILDIDSARGFRTDAWHIDFAYLDAYPKILVLRGAVIPPVGGDTMWSNTAAAYLDLPAPLQRLADGLWAVHSNAYDFAIFARPTEAEKTVHNEGLDRASFETEHPVVRVHPETGERTLVLGLYVNSFIGLPKYDGQKVFDLFESHITAPENTVRWSWKQGDVAIWDNLATMHYAVRDYGDQHRVVRRVAIDGEVPVGVDGRRSVARIKIIRQPPASIV